MMKICLFQNLFDILRGKKRVHITVSLEKKERKRHLYKIPWFLRHKVDRLTDGALISRDRKALERISKKYEKTKEHSFYEDVTDWSYENVMPVRYKNQMEFLQEDFIPLLKKTDALCDFGCASGEFSFMMLPYVNEVDGYDFSEKMIETAQKKAHEKNLENIRFRFGNATDKKLDKQYDAFSLLGVLCYIFDDALCQKAVYCISDHLKTGGYCVYKDNSNGTKNDFFVSNPLNDYQCAVRSRKKIFSFFKNAGFKLVKTRDLDRFDVNTENGKKLYTSAPMIALFVKERL